MLQYNYHQLKISYTQPILENLFEIKADLENNIIEDLYGYKIKKNKIILYFHTSEENISYLSRLNSIEELSLSLYNRTGKILSKMIFSDLNSGTIKLSSNYENDNLLKIGIKFKFKQLNLLY